MATPITFKSVQARSNGSALAALSRAGQNLGNAIQGVGGDLQNFADEKSKQETDEFVSYINSLGSDEERNQALQDANKAFLDIGKANEAVTSAQVQDFAVNAEERAQTESEANVFSQGIADQLKNEQILKFQTEGPDIAAKLTTERKAAEFGLEQKTQQLKDKEETSANLTTIAGQNASTHIGGLSLLALSNDNAGIVDPRPRAQLHQKLQQRPATISTESLNSVTRADGTVDYSIAGRTRLISSMVNELQVEAPAADRGILEDIAKKAIAESPHAKQFKESAEVEGANRVERKRIENDSIVGEGIESQASNGNNSADYATTRSRLIVNGATAKQLARYDNETRQPALDNTTISLTRSLSEESPDDLPENIRAILDKTSGQIKSSDVTALNQYVKQLAKSNFKNLTQTELEEIHTRSVSTNPELAKKFNQAGVRLAIDRKVSARVIQIAADSRLSIEEAKLVAKQEDDLIREKANTPSANVHTMLTPVLRQYVDSIATPGYIAGDGKIANDTLQKTISVVDAAIREHGDNTIGKGDRTILVRNLILTMSIGDFLNNTLAIKAGNVTGINPVNSAEIFEAALRLQSPGKTAFTATSSGRKFHVKQLQKEKITFENRLKSLQDRLGGNANEGAQKLIDTTAEQIKELKRQIEEAKK